jgi:hypothetical protein
MPECKRCRAVFLDGEAHDCRDIKTRGQIVRDLLLAVPGGLLLGIAIGLPAMFLFGSEAWLRGAMAGGMFSGVMWAIGKRRR